jgi:signal transduction histidine kinase/ligand-binding sensor domain-containing protein
MLQKVIFIACVFMGASCFAQQYPFVHYTPKDGLVNSRVRNAYQDSKGRMYFLTYGGLSVYDGARFSNYTRQNGLISEVVNDVLEAGSDSMLVAVNTRGLNVLVNGHMKKLPLQGGHQPIINYFLKSNGRIFISADEGLYTLAGNSTRKLPVFSPSGAPLVFLGAITACNDYIVFTTNELKNNKGLFVYSIKENRITDALEQVTVHSLQNDRTGIIWVSTPKAIHNLDTIALGSGKLVLRPPYTAGSYQQPFPAGYIKFDRQNVPLVISYTGDIIRFDKKGTALTITSPDPSGSAGFHFFIDRENILWLCHEGNGVYKLPATNLRVRPFIFPGNHSGIRYARAFNRQSVCVVMNNGEWMLSTPSSVIRFRTPASFKGVPLQWNEPWLYAIDNRNLYITRLTDAPAFRKIMTLPDTSGFGGESVTDPYGNIILFESRRILVMRQEKLIFSLPVYLYDLVHGMYIDTHNRLRVVSRSGGLAVYSLHPEAPSHYLRKESQFTAALGDASPRCMAVDKNEIQWIGTRHNGLFAFEYTNGQLRQLHHFNTTNGLTDNFVTSVACDEQDNIIIGTQTGLDRLVKINNRAYRLENLTRSNNIFAFIYYTWTDILNNAFALTQSGVMYQVEPVQPAITVKEPQLFIEKMEVNGQWVSPPASTLRLPYYQRNISFSMAAPTFIDEKQVQYSYLLEGSGNKQWSAPSPVATISLLNLSPGHYSLHIKALFPSTSYAPKETVFSFSILHPWWQTWWFRSAVIVVIIALLVILTRSYYLRKLEKQKTILEKKQAVEKERTRIATDMHDDLGAGLSKIKFLSETIGIKQQQQQPIGEDIGKIKEYSHEMISKMGEIVWALNEKNDSLSDLLSYTRSYAAEYLLQHDIHCTVTAPDELPVAFVSSEFRRNIFLAVKEALHNIVKHAQASHVHLDMQATHNLHIGISDNGTGFDPAHTRPYSNGLVNIKKRIKDIGGSVNIQASGSTSISLDVPLNV